MDAVIEQFLNFARHDENEKAVAVDLEILVREVSQRFVQQAVSFALDIQPIPRLLVRPLLLKRALGNLLENAIKYGGGEIDVQLFTEKTNVVMSVADHGPGIAEAQRDSAKRPFIRLNAARGDTHGSGLGLAIVERAAKLHGGDFILMDAPSGGLLAKMVLPIQVS